MERYLRADEKRTACDGPWENVKQEGFERCQTCNRISSAFDAPDVCGPFRREQHRKDLADSIHTYFELSYASYLAIPRSVLQSMPKEWQAKFVVLLRELDATFDYRREGCTIVHVSGKDLEAFDEAVSPLIMDDELNAYDRGRRVLDAKEIAAITERHNKAYVYPPNRGE